LGSWYEKASAPSVVAGAGRTATPRSAMAPRSPKRRDQHRPRATWIAGLAGPAAITLALWHCRTV